MFAVLTTAALATSIFAGCTKNEDKKTDDTKKTVQTQDIKPEKDAKLTVWDNGDQEGEWAKYVAKEFEKKYDIKVKVVKTEHTKAPEKIELDGPANVGPDVFSAPSDHVGKMVKGGHLLENVFADEYKKDFLESSVDGTSFKEKEMKMYGYPTAIETYALYYNKDLVSKVPETWDELFKMAKDFQDGAPKGKRYGLMMEPGNFYYNHAYLGGLGGYVFGDKNTNPNDLGLNNEGAIKAGKFMQTIHKELLPLKKEDISGDVISSYFNENKLMFRVSGPWDIKNHQNAKVNFGIAPLPKLENGETPKSLMGIKAYYVSSHTKYPKAASLYAKFATSEDMLMKRYELTGQLPPNTKLLDNEKIKNDKIASAFLEQAKEATPMPNIPQMQTVWGPMESAFTTIWNDNTDPKVALDAAVKQIQDAIKTQKK